MPYTQGELIAALHAATEVCAKAIASFPKDGSYDEYSVSAYLEAAHQQQLIQTQMRENNENRI